MSKDQIDFHSSIQLMKNVDVKTLHEKNFFQTYKEDSFYQPLRAHFQFQKERENMQYNYVIPSQYIMETRGRYQHTSNIPDSILYTGSVGPIGYTGARGPIGPIGYAGTGARGVPYQNIPFSIEKNLDFSSQNLTEWPKEILNEELHTIRMVNLNRNQLSTLPNLFDSTLINSQTKFFHSIRYLSLRNNRLKEIPEHIIQFTNLIFLDLGNNQITHLPHALAGLKRLQFINVCGNPIKTIDEKLYIGRIFCNSDFLVWRKKMQETFERIRDNPKVLCNEGELPVGIGVLEEMEICYESLDGYLGT